MATKRLYKASAMIAVLIVLLGLWYYVAANFDYDALAGRYVLNQGGEKCTLTLRRDRTFAEEIDRGGEVQRAQGTWDRYGEAHVSFSSGFLKLSGQELNASGEAHGQFDKTLGLLPYLTLAPLPNGPTLRRNWFH